MSKARQLADVGFHAGELAVQQQVGVRAEAGRLTPMLKAAALTGGIARFLNDRTFLVVTGRDPTGRQWTTPLVGPPGFLVVLSETALGVHAVIPVGDPLHGIRAGAKVGMVAVEFAARRRVRINGTVSLAEEGLMVVEVEQAYGNCPQYIQQRLLGPRELPSAQFDNVRRDVALSPEDVEMIRAADTFFIGTTHPRRGADASHRGGPPGFVRVDGHRLWWPDYPGNNMFNSLGNLAVDPKAALLFIDFRSGRLLQLSGVAVAEFDRFKAGDDGGTGRRVVYDIQHVVSGGLLAARETAYRPYPRNPALTD